MSELNPTMLTEEQMQRIREIEGMNRAQRRKLGKQLRTKIPGNNVPIRKYAHHKTKENI